MPDTESVKAEINPGLKEIVIEVILQDIKARGPIFREIYRQLSREAASHGKSFFAEAL